MTPIKPTTGEEPLDHPCRATCSGWQQGYERGMDERQMRINELEMAVRERNREFVAATENYNRINGLRNEAEAREQRLIEAFEKSVKMLRDAARSAPFEMSVIYNLAAEWARAALDKAKGEKE